MSGLLARTCRQCQRREVCTSTDTTCIHCGAAYGRFQIGLDWLMDEGETEAPAWPTKGAAITRTIRSAAGLDT